MSNVLVARAEIGDIESMTQETELKKASNKENVDKL